MIRTVYEPYTICSYRWKLSVEHIFSPSVSAARSRSSVRLLPLIRTIYLHGESSLHRVVREGRITHTSLTLCRLVSDFTYSVMVGQWLYIPCGGWSVTLHTLWWLVSDFVYSVVVGQWLNILCDGWPVTLCTLWWLVSDFTYSVMVGQWLHILWPFFS